MGTCVAVLNMKGGVGKTTMSAHVMSEVFKVFSVNTLLIDLDAQFNLTQALLPVAQYEALERANKTVMAVMESDTSSSLFDVRPVSPNPPEVAELSHTLRTQTSAGGQVKLDLIPGDFRLVKYSLVDHRETLKKARERFLRFVRNARQDYELIVIDCNPSSSFITLCALHACDRLVIPVRADKYSVVGLRLLSSFLDREASLSRKPDLVIVANGVGRGDSNTVLTSLRADTVYGRHVLTRELPHSAFLEARTSYTGFATDRGGPYSSRLRTAVRSLAHELGTRLGF